MVFLIKQKLICWLVISWPITPQSIGDDLRDTLYMGPIQDKIKLLICLYNNKRNIFRHTNLNIYHILSYHRTPGPSDDNQVCICGGLVYAILL